MTFNNLRLDRPTAHVTCASVFPASSPVARDHWEIFEFIIKESGDEFFFFVMVSLTKSILSQNDLQF